jgi:hypothetical protein
MSYIMKHHCPPGVICIENITLCTLCICIFVIGIWIYVFRLPPSSSSVSSSSSSLLSYHQETNNKLNTFDVLLNPYTPPIKDESHHNDQWNKTKYNPYFNQHTHINALPDASFRQVGFLSSEHHSPIALMGKPLYSNRDKWQYYSMSDQQNSIKLPLLVKGKSAMNEYGCNKLESNDTIVIDGLKDTYKVTLYESNY